MITKIGYNSIKATLHYQYSWRKLTAEQLAAVTKIMSDQQLNIDSIKRLTSRASVVIEENPRSCVQLSVSGLIRIKLL
jgi:phosphoserine phosphatase